MFLRIVAISVSLLMLGAMSANAQEVVSVYTSLDDCEWIESDGEGVSAFCTGYEDYTVYAVEVDLRMAVVFGELADYNLWLDGFLTFNYVNDILEWRIENGKAYATILRWFVTLADAEGEMFEKEILVVSSVADPDLPIAERTSCHVAYVDPSLNVNANQLARQVAHLAARTFRCGVDTPIYVGVIGPSVPSGGAWHSINFED